MVDREKTMKLNLTVERIRSELFTGGFRPMEEIDFHSYSGADPGSLIANLDVDQFSYEVIFSPVLGNVQIISYDGEYPHVWEMDLKTGDFIELF